MTSIEPSARIASRGARPAPLAVLIVALVALVPYLVTIGYGFVYDDGPIIADNPALHAPAGLLTAWRVAYWPAEWGRAGLFRPVVQFMYALLWNVSGGAAWLFHLYAVVLYAACAIAVLWLLARALPINVAFIGAVIFAAHPLHVESVANVAGSAEVVAALASIACVLVVVRAFDAAAELGASVSWSTAIYGAVLFGVALGAKESAATVPALVALCVWGWRSRDDDPIGATAVIARGWRVWAAFIVVLVLMIVARRAVLGGLSPPSTALAVGLDGATLAQRWWTMTGAWPLIAQLLVFPTRLSMYYGPTTVIPQRAINAPAMIGVAAFALVVLGAAIVARRGDRRPLVALGWVVLAYLAASNILVPTGQLLAERTLFVSSVGVSMIVAWMLERVETFPERAHRLAFVLAAVVACAGVWQTVRRVPVWSSEERLFRSGIDYDSAAFYPYWQLARSVGRHGDNARGLALLDDAYRRYPAGESLSLEYAQHLRTSGRADDALMILRATSAAHPASQPVRLAYLDALLELRGADSVIEAVQDVRGHDPAGSLRYVLLARAYAKLDRADSVTAVYGRAVAEDGEDPGLRYAYAAALHASHQDADAQRELDRAAASGEMPPAVRYALQTRISLARGDSAGARRAIALARQAAPADSGLAALDSALRAGRR